MYDVIIIGLALLVLRPVKALAQGHLAYSNEAGVEVERTSWMGGIGDERLLSSLSLPGTHDSASNGPGGILVRNQRKSIRDQLLSGIRFLDIRARLYQGDFAIHHDLVYLNKNFADVLRETTEFLKQYPSETIYMRVKQEYSKESDDEFANRFERYLEELADYGLIYMASNRNPRLGDTRGKLVFLRDFKGSSYGLNYADFEIQDRYQLRSIWDLYKHKWLPIKGQLIRADEDRQQRQFINYLSGSGGVFPYFVASGHIFPKTDGRRLLMGLTTLKCQVYPDFPRVRLVLGLSAIVFEGTNTLTQNYIMIQGLQHVGIVVADFPGPGLIEAIITRNYDN